MPSLLADLTAPALRELASVENECLVSIYAPMQAAGGDFVQNQVRWKTIVKQLDSKLTNLELSSSTVKQIIGRVVELVEDHGFWRKQTQGLSAFVLPDSIKLYRLNGLPEQEVRVDRKYHVRPLLTEINRDSRYLVLAASQTGLKLLEVMYSKVKSVFPVESWNTALCGFDVSKFAAAANVYLNESRQEASNGQCFSANHAVSVNTARELHSLFRSLEKLLQADRMLENEPPLVFAGSEQLFEVYKNASQYSRLCGEPIIVNPDEVSDELLSEYGHSILEQDIDVRSDQLVDDFLKQRDSVWASSDPAEIYRSAIAGQVERLLISDQYQCYGRVSKSHDLEIENNGCRKVDSRDLCNDTILETIRNGGEAFTIPDRKLPANTKIAALFGQ